MKKSLFIAAGVFAAIVIVINLVIKTPTFDNLWDKANFEIQSNQPELAEQTLFDILGNDTYNIDNHYNYINTHFNIPEKKRVGKSQYEYRNDEKILEYYDSLSKSTDTILSDIGFYGKGLILTNLYNYPDAIAYYYIVKNKKQKYLNNSLGYVHQQVGAINRAKFYYNEEIANKGNISGAYSNLIQLHYYNNEIAELKHLLKNPEIRQYFSPRIERIVYFKTLQPLKYIVSFFKQLLTSINFWGFVAAFLIMASWVIFLRKLDIYEAEKWKYIVITVLSGMLFTFVTYPLTDINNQLLGFNLNGGLINDFFYCVFGIGAVEEFVKIIPLLLMLRFTKAINEPFDYILYASLSALGFAFVENLIYFEEHRLNIIHGRALTAVIAHMFDSSIIAYGLILNKYKTHRNPYLTFALFLLLASLAHGFYDFWLINETANTFSILTILFLLSSLFVWNTLKNNALNHSDFFDKDKQLDNEKLYSYLLYCLVGVLLFEYIALSLKFSPSAANSELLASLTSGTYLILFISSSLSKYNLVKGQWAPIKYWGKEKIVNYDFILEHQISLKRFTANELTLEYLPNVGKIEKRIFVSDEPDWYVVQLENSTQNTQFETDKIVLRTKDKHQLIEKDKETIVAFFLIPNNTNLGDAKLKRTNFKFCGWAKVECNNEQII